MITTTKGKALIQFRITSDEILFLCVMIKTQDFANVEKRFTFASNGQSISAPLVLLLLGVDCNRYSAISNHRSARAGSLMHWSRNQPGQKGLKTAASSTVQSPMMKRTAVDDLAPMTRALWVGMQ